MSAGISSLTIYLLRPFIMSATKGIILTMSALRPSGGAEDGRGEMKDSAIQKGRNAEDVPYVKQPATDQRR